MTRDLESAIEARTRLLLAHCREHRFPLTGDHRVSEASAAALLGVHGDTLRKWRAAGEGPSYFRVGGSISYAVQDLAAYIVTCRYAAAGPRMY